MSHRVTEPVRMAGLIVGCLLLGVVLCLLLAGAVHLSLSVPSAAPVLVILAAILALALAYLGFRFLIGRLL